MLATLAAHLAARALDAFAACPDVLALASRAATRLAQRAVGALVGAVELAQGPR